MRFSCLLAAALDRAALSYWSPEKKTWVADPGEFEVQVGPLPATFD